MLTKHVETVEKMYNLLKQHHVAIPPEDEVQLDDLHNELDEYKVDMEAAMKFKEDLLPEMSTSLGLSINRLNQNLDAITASLGEGVYIDVSNFEDPAPVLEEGDLGVTVADDDALGGDNPRAGLGLL